MKFDIIKETTGKASEYAPYVIELYEKRKGRTEQVENALNRLSKDAALLKGNKNSRKILLCSKTDPYPPDYECHTITREAIQILDNNELKYVILTEYAMRVISDFEQLKHPENIKLILKIASIPRNRENISKPYKNHMDLIFTPLDYAFKKGLNFWIDLNPAIYPRLSLELIHKYYPIVNQWNVGKDSFEPKTKSKSTWEKFKEDAKEFFKTLETLSPWTSGNIPIRKGKCNTLVIAPHGHKKDDENTGEIAWQIADILNCYAVINEFYHKPPNKKDKKGGEEPEEANKKKKWVNLNNLDQITEQLDEEEFLGQIKKFKDKIVSRFGKAQIFLIHGITDDNIKKESKIMNADPELGALIGIGRGNPNEDPDRLSAHPDTAANLMELLQSNKERKIIAAEASQGHGHGGYAGCDERNLNQLFTYKNENAPNVQSIQIEIKMTGYRNDVHIPNTAIIFADAFEKMDNLKPIKESSFWPALAKKCEVKEISTGEIDLSDEKFKFRIEDYGINQKKLDGLIKSIKTNEILNNIIVRKSGDKEEYQLISGFRRLSAFEKICEERGEDFSNEKIWAKVFTKLSDEDAYNISFAENLAREDLSIWEIANSCKAISDDLQKAGKSKSDIEKHLVELMQKGDRTVRRYLHVSTIQNKEIRKEIHNGNLDFTTAELFAKKEFNEENRVELHQFYKKHPMSSREFEQFTRNLLALTGWADLKIKEILSFPRAAIFLKIDPEQLKNNVEYLNKQTDKPVNHILERNIAFLKDSLSGIEAKFAKKPFLKKFSKRSKALESKIGKVFDTQKVGANLSIKPAGDVENEMVKVVISAPASNIQKAIKLMDREIGKDFARLKDLWEKHSASASNIQKANAIVSEKTVKKNLKKITQTNETLLPIKRSKYQDWVYKTVSCFNGCSNDCIYCFAKGDAVNKKRMKVHEWKEGKVRLHDLNKKHKLYDNTVMFPGSHDFTTDNFDACFSVLKKILAANNRVLIVSKPRLKHITKLCDDLKEYKKNMLFRFTIGSMNNKILSFWEQDAPLYEERIQALEYAFNAGYRTSVSVEPMLDFEHIEELVNDLSPYVNYSIWIGTMQHFWYMDTDESAAKSEAGKLRAKHNTEYYGEAKAQKIREEIEKIKKGQSKENLEKIYGKLKDNPLVKWKWHIKEAVGLPQPDTPEEWPAD